MKILLDENLDHRLRNVLAPHDAVTTVYAGWSGLRNGELLKAAEEQGFEMFVTADRNLAYQQNLATREIALVVLTAHSWTVIQPHLGRIQEAITQAKPGSFQIVDCGRFRRS